MDWNKLLLSKRIKRSKVKDIRNEYESDYGRIIFSPALRRMHDKTQVFPLTTDDNIHSRLTHSNEVMSIGYTLGLKLSKSSLIQEKTGKTELDLIRILPILLQNVCLIHDIGNAPFGHFGETIVSDYFKNLEQNSPQFRELTERQKLDFLNYDGNAQGLRVLTKLQYLDNPFGLNLTFATLASYLKYPNYEKLDDKIIEKSKHGIFESEEDYFHMIMEECGLKIGDRFLRHPLCYLMEAADSIAYLTMDMEDGFNKHLYDISYIRSCFEGKSSDISRRVVTTCKDPYLSDNAKIVNIRITLISYLVELAYSNFESNLALIEKGKYNKELIKNDENKIYKILADFCKDKVFSSREINYLESAGHSIYKGLLDFYIEFVFNENDKYVKRARRLISTSIVECAIEESLIPLGERKLDIQLKNLIQEIEKGNEKSKNETKKAAIKENIRQFNLLKHEYSELFKKQLVAVVEGEELEKLNAAKQKIRKLIEPKFEDLDNYYKFRVILDFISGMTDQYALNHYQKISGQKIS